MLENGVYIIKGNAEIEKIELFNKTECSSCIRFNCNVYISIDEDTYKVNSGYVDLLNSIIKIHINFGNQIECKIEDFVRKYECDL